MSISRKPGRQRRAQTKAPAPPPPRRPMVDWYDPRQLLSTGVEVLISAAMGQRSDYRLMVEDAVPQPVFNYTRDKGAARHELWFDYLADTGDGWNSTYAVASLVAQRELRVHDLQNRKELTLERGRFLILGGDEVYPVASKQNYRERLKGPFEAALRWSDPPEIPHLFAIPGNHDWYDGLISFARRFFQGRWVGGWRTRQRRSYFALKLPHRWWLWAVDVQLESDIDPGQLEYFTDVSRNLKPGDRIVLASAEPDWLYRDITEPAAESNLAYLEQKVIAPRGAYVHVWLAGDLHHYRRHQHVADPSRQRITSGGGGAYLSPTHRPLLTPSSNASRRTIDVGKERFEEKCAFPAPSTTFRLSLLNLLFVFKNWKVGLLTGFAYAALTWGQAPIAWTLFPPLMDLLDYPTRFLWIAAVLLGFIFFADCESAVFRMIGGSFHGLAHIAAALTVAYWTALWFPPEHGFWAPLWRLGLNFVGGGVLGPMILGLYLFVSLNLFGAHAAEAFSALRIADYKHFLRFHITPMGRLEIYPIGIDRVPREEEAGARYRLIEGPVIIDPPPVKRSATMDPPR